MLNWLKRHFIPHEGNDNRPHLLRNEGTQVLLFILLATQALFLAYSFIIVPGSRQVAAVIVSTLIDETNSERSAANVGALKTNPLLTASAQLKANDMALRGYFAHDAPDGTSPWHWFQVVGYDYQYAGENLAVNFIDSKDITNAWMHSPTHRDNLLNGKYTEVGIATAVGKYKGRDAIFVVQHFGTPLAAPIVPSDVNFAPAQPTAVTSANDAARVLGASTVAAAPTLMAEFSKLAAHPRTVALLIELAVALIVSTALVLAFFIHIRVQHPAILGNGVILIALTVGLALVNSILAKGAI